MATFAELHSNKVSNIVKVRNIDIAPTQGQTEEEAGIEYLNNLFPNTTWKQVYYGNIPSVGHIYDPITGEFTEPTPEIEDEENEETP